ncbi:YisL family protein [Paenisporosarcina sp. TG20]|uniref:YisL family protein n=1 Tax=Paenisporosarcina sp. TG20 TaxID=1211706 RepID=UPI0002F37C7E|nr:YisL family protein [Paenisporosarcina sp. TG20]
MDFLANTNLHIATWVIGIILFLVAVFLKDGSKGQKITHMVLRLFYVFIIITGIALFIEGMSFDMGMLYGFKLIGGILVIGMMEMVLVRMKKQKPTTMFWILLFVFLFITMFLGFKLPMGINFLA